ncbi:MAG: hypothetical protein NCW75_07475 [Phycisphaera sp.]|nr:MAG: hypothetical protein NCW75_07475 [Phycisphaera sp.]
MTQKKSGLIKNIVLLLVVVACGLGAWYFISQKGSGAMNEADIQEWFDHGEMASEGLDLEGVKTKLNHDSPQDMGEGRYRFDMSHVSSKNTLVVEVVVRGGRAVSHNIVEPARAYADGSP